MSFAKFPSLESFSHVWRNQSRLMDGPVVTFGAKIKLHGTNAAIRCEGGEVFAQKRTSDVDVHADNAGFANWLEPRKAAWAIPHKDIPETVIYYGEWAGPGVQKGDAVSLLSKKYFFIFAVQIDDYMIVEPSEIETYLPKDVGGVLDDVLVLPWATDEITVDFSDPTKTDVLVEYLNDIVAGIAECDPFIMDTFEIEGQGEGLVVVPKQVYGDKLTRDEYSAFTFKVKAEHHGVKKMKNPASRKFDIPDGAKEFIDMFVTEARCMQGLMEACDGIAEKPRTADFLKWMGNDVRKESVVEMEEAGLEWSQIAKLVNTASVGWFHKKCAAPFASAV
ncbi:RNA ligase2 [Ruegeria phage vB_RpoS-V10]|nr:RNA ligase 2 [Roseobacter phage DSS3P8]AWY09212.1 RNA ligase2 [Ruegeria phage vB_RpoS-V10]